MTPLSAVSNSSLHALALQWLKDDKLHRKQEEDRGNRARTRGARRDQVRQATICWFLISHFNLPRLLDCPK